ncbi:aminoglycoside phosphotransferase (APT) family kinase protein [Paenibacillus castaneae]|uniref:phosphotransferase n=1 Tax=Paenibacillus castaneae TaxID=474957 RepID=UPI000C9CE4CB|nr:phosphotransferase [Paenibacillus castaneae]NIK77795.1 aminoglycoside phosphotransferase (APT) family kinase protein [Paenibacillus castaneae]
MITKMGNKIGEGGCSEIFEWENANQIIKLARDNTDYHAMKQEYDNSRMAWENGLSVPQPIALVDMEGRPGIVFERIYGETMMERFVKKAMERGDEEEASTEHGEYNDIRLTAQVLSEIHNKPGLRMPSQREAIKNSINSVDYLSKDEKAAVISLLEDLPVKNQLCHGDPNPRNMLLRNGKAVVIDWMNASIGNPEADLAEYIIMFRYAILPDYYPKEITSHLDSNREAIINAFVEEYTRLAGITSNEIDAWIAPIAARKLSADGISEEEKILLIHEIRRRLQEQKD